MPVFEHVQSMTMLHLLWRWFASLCFVMELYGKWLDNTTCTEVILFNQILLQSVRQLCTISCALNGLSDWPIGKVIFFWLLANMYLLSSSERKKRNNHIYLVCLSSDGVVLIMAIIFFFSLHLFSFHLSRIIEELFFVWLGFLFLPSLT